MSFTLDRFNPGTHWTGGWVDPRANLDAVRQRKKKLLPPSGMELRRPRDNYKFFLYDPGSIAGSGDIFS
jgi:hypothetical protein